MLADEILEKISKEELVIHFKDLVGKYTSLVFENETLRKLLNVANNQLSYLNSHHEDHGLSGIRALLMPFIEETEFKLSELKLLVEHDFKPLP